MQEFEQVLAPGRAKPRRQIRNLLFGQIARDRIQHAVAEPACRVRLSDAGAGADDEFVLVEPGDEAYRVGGPMLTVGIENKDEIAGGVSDARFNRCAVAFVVGMTDDAGARICCAPARVVGGPVVDDDDLPPRCGSTKLRDERADRRAFVERRHDDRDALCQRARHFSAACISLSIASSHEMPRTRS